jgi:MbtH protein
VVQLVVRREALLMLFGHACPRGQVPNVERTADCRSPPGSERRSEAVATESAEHDRFKVVINDEEQYSIWPAERENASGWRDEGTVGTKQECLDHVDRTWTDMRPLSLRRRTAATEG